MDAPYEVDLRSVWVEVRVGSHAHWFMHGKQNVSIADVASAVGRSPEPIGVPRPGPLGTYGRATCPCSTLRQCIPAIAGDRKTPDYC
jgi:hypothetical protein